MKKTIAIFIILSFFTITLFGKEKVLISKWFRNKNTYVIVCRGWPKESLTGKKRIESAKEAALINAQFIARDIFNKSVDVVKNGTIEKYKTYKNHVTIYYTVKKKGLKYKKRNR